MWPEAGTITFSTPDAFDATLRAVRSSLTARALAIGAELDIAGRIASNLRIQLPPCRILYIRPDPPAELSANAWLVLPLHLVVSSRGNRTDLCVLDVLPRAAGILNSMEREVVNRTQRDIVRSLENISVRTSFT